MAWSFSPPNGSGASFWTRSGVDGTSTLVPTLFSDSVAVVMLATIYVEGLSAQSVVNSLIAAVIAAIVVILLKGHS